MGYRVVFRGRYGNTTVEVEDLARNGTGCGAKSCQAKAARCADYPGECQHCGKLHIRYLAHVDQDIADTLLRATDATHEKALHRSDLEVATLGIQAIEGNTATRMDVGCVCVAKYLVDCGVDAGLAQRFQEAIGRVTSQLQKVAALEASMTDERIARSMERAAIVLGLRARRDRAYLVGCKSRYPRLNEEPFYRRHWAVQTQARNEYEVARKRWETENHGFKSNAFGDRFPLTAERLRAFFESKIDRATRQLDRNAGVSYVA